MAIGTRNGMLMSEYFGNDVVGGQWHLALKQRQHVILTLLFVLENYFLAFYLSTARVQGNELT